MHVTIKKLTSGYVVEVKRDVVGLGPRTLKHACKDLEEVMFKVIEEGRAVTYFDCKRLERMLDEKRPRKEGEGPGGSKPQREGEASEPSKAAGGVA